MSKQIYIDNAGGNIISCLAENGKLLEFQMEKRYGRVVVGSIYKGKVENVLNGMQAAFVNIGLEKNGYLFIGEMLVDRSDLDGAVELPGTLNLSVGDEIMVQVVKDASGSKGVRLTTHVSFAGRNLVYLPTFELIGVSRKLTDDELRTRLTAIAEEIKPERGGFIIRTAAENASTEELRGEAAYLERCYKEVLHAFENAKAGEMLFEEGDLARRTLRDVYTSDVDNIIVAERALYDELLVEAGKRGEDVVAKVQLFDKQNDIFAEYGLDKEIDAMLRNTVYLSSGAYLIIDRTEALTAIDVNTGKYTGENSLEQTVYETNMLAAIEIARQLRLRNIGGIIIVDFIDMEEEEHRNSVLEVFRNALKDDRAKCNVLGMTGLGLVELTRKKKRRESTSKLVKKCPYCKGDGVIFSNDYIVMKIRIALLDTFAKGFSSAIIDVNTEIADYIFRCGCLSRDISRIWRGKRIYLVPHNTYHQEFFLVKGENSAVLDLPDKARQVF